MITFTSNDFVKSFSSDANASIQDNFGSEAHVVIGHVHNSFACVSFSIWCICQSDSNAFDVSDVQEIWRFSDS
jgi:hypothetical protein